MTSSMLNTTTSDYSYYDWGTLQPGMEDEDICPLDPDPDGTLVQTYVHSFICVFGLMGNLLVIVTYAFYKRSRTMTDLFLLNVAVADLLFVATLPLTIYNEQLGWPMAPGACKAARGLYSINLYAGMLLLACVGGDRYVAIVHARRSFGAGSRSLIQRCLVCGAVWGLAVALSLPTLIYTERIEEADLLRGEAVSVTCALNFDGKLMKVLVPALQVGVGFLLPLALMAFCYGSVLRCLFRAQDGGQRRKAVRVVLAVVVVFVVCHLPYNAALLSHTAGLFRERSCEAERRKLSVMAFSRSVAYLHCCLNPVLYAFVGVKFRRHFRKILQDTWCLGKRFVQPGCSSSNAATSVYVLGRRSTSVSQNGSSFSV
ncbi:C-C chemokine receptor type 6 [Gadus macrocephalus]|uniref:C-C chemokine receptor type 6 n=1 Tax=Gadus macrocephalus TaxID=80720 RepID=UPI0028CB231A|nr:C-C chemokine receptor type 6 [Gadus macrocephalus]